LNTSLILNIQKCCVHDGPGIRTTIFFKGCPLNCIWCHNPESQSYKTEIMYNQNKCTNCNKCITNCPNNAISFSENNFLIHDDSLCKSCMNCVDFCISEAIQFAGKSYSISQLISEIKKDQVFYDDSNGGVTLSGGEVMCQIDFVEKLCKKCKENNIHVAIDTCGYVPYENFERITPYVDLFLYDIKLINSKKHFEFTGKPSELIINNLNKLSLNGANIILRLPIIEGINADNEHLNNLCSLISNLNLQEINLLPYHDIGGYKYSNLNKNYNFDLMKKPSDEILNHFKSTLSNYNSNIKIGG